MSQISKVFIHRRYKFDKILEDFCNDEDVNTLSYKKIQQLENYLLFKLNLKEKLYGHKVENGTRYEEYISDNEFILRKIENNIDGHTIENIISDLLVKHSYFEDKQYLIREPNGKNTFPDFIDKYGNFYDSKAVRCKEGIYKYDLTEILIQIPNYNNACGSRDTVCNEILNKTGIFNSFVIFVYYNENYIVDLKIMPLVYCLNINENKELAIKSAGKNGEIKNSNVCISLPSAFSKTELPSWEEKKLEVLNAVNKYFENKGD